MSEWKDYSEENRAYMDSEGATIEVANRAQEIDENVPMDLTEWLCSKALDALIRLRQKFPKQEDALAHEIFSGTAYHRAAMELMEPEMFKEFYARTAAYHETLSRNMRRTMGEKE